MVKLIAVEVFIRQYKRQNLKTFNFNNWIAFVLKECQERLKG